MSSSFNAQTKLPRRKWQRFLSALRSSIRRHKLWPHEEAGQLKAKQQQALHPSSETNQLEKLKKLAIWLPISSVRASKFMASNEDQQSLSWKMSDQAVDICGAFDEAAASLYFFDYTDREQVDPVALTASGDQPSSVTHQSVANEQVREPECCQAAPQSAAKRASRSESNRRWQKKFREKQRVSQRLE